MPTFGSYRPRARSWRNYRPPRPRVGGPSRPPDVPNYGRGLPQQMPPPPFVPGGQPGGVAPGGAPPGAPGAAAPGTPDYAAQARQQVSGILDPQLAYIANRYNQQALGTSNAISGLTGSYAGLLGQIGSGTGAMFEQAKSPVAAAAAGVNAQIAHTGAQTAATEAQSASQAGLPQGAGGADVSPQGLTQTGKGAGGAAGAIGQAAIDALTGEQKAAMTYAGKLPGFAALRGDYETQTALSQIAGQMADSLAQTAAQAPQLYYTIYQNLLDRADKDKSFRESVREWNIGQKQRQQAVDQATQQRKAGVVGPNAPTVAGQKRYWDAIAAQRTQDTGYLWQGTNSGIRPVDVNPKAPGIQTQVTLQGQAAATKLGTPITKNVPGVGLVQYDPNTGQWVPRVRTPKKPVTSPKVDLPLSKATGTWVDSSGNPVSMPGKPPPKAVPGAPKVNIGLSRIFRTWVDSSGNPVPGLKSAPPPPAPSGSAKGPGTAPRLVQGEWRTVGGQTLSSQAAHYWTAVYQAHYTDGRGRMVHPLPPGWKPGDPAYGSSKSGGTTTGSTRIHKKTLP